MNWWLAYNVALGVGLVIVGAWAFESRRLMKKAARLIGLHHEDQPTQEIPMLPTAKVGPRPNPMPTKPPPGFVLSEKPERKSWDQRWLEFEWWPPERR